MEERSKALKQGKEQLCIFLATVLQEKDRMRFETNGRKKKSFKAGKNNLLIILYRLYKKYTS